MTIEELANHEMHIHNDIEAAWKEKRKISEEDEAKNYKAYAVIYQEYLGLALDGNVEALKRAFFIQWYGFIEPMYLTGIDFSLIDSKDNDAILTEIENRIKSGVMDLEFEALLQWAYSIVDFYFEGKDTFPALTGYLSRVDKAEDHLWKFDASKMTNRGILGVYYLSILENKIDSKKKNNGID